MKPRRRGLTLLEAMLSMFFVVLLLGLFASLAHEFDLILKQSAARANTLTTLQLGMRQLLDEVRQASPGALWPGPGGSASELRLSRPSQDLSVWLPASAPASPWVPPAAQLRVRYYLAQGQLVREAGSPATVQSLTEGLSDFQVQARPGGPSVIEVQMTQGESRRRVVIRGLAVVGRF